MPQQLIYTSAPRGLVAGRSGYCTVARSANMREAVALRLEQLSYYHHVSLTGGQERPIFAYRILDLRGSRFHVMSRLQDAGLDYTGRTNFIAHHLVVSPDELRDLPTPAVILRDWSGWLSAWTREPEPLVNESWGNLRELAEITSVPALTWQKVTGDAVNGYGLLEVAPGSTFFTVITDSELLSLIAECMELSEVRDARRDFRSAAWQFSFTTSLQEQDNPSDFKWRFVHRGSSALPKAFAGGGVDLSDLRAKQVTDEEQTFAKYGWKAPSVVKLMADRNTITEGESIKLHVVADGTPRPSFRWFEVEFNQSTELAGAYGNALQTRPQGRSKRYYVRAWNRKGHKDSAVVEVTINQEVRLRQHATRYSRASAERTEEDMETEHEDFRKRKGVPQGKSGKSRLLTVTLRILVTICVFCVGFYLILGRKIFPKENQARTAVVRKNTVLPEVVGAPEPQSQNTSAFSASDQILNPPDQYLLPLAEDDLAPIKPPWNLTRLGAVGQDADALASATGFMIKARGTGPVQVVADNCFFVQRCQDSPIAFEARLHKTPEFDQYSWCGIMIRESESTAPCLWIGANSKHVMWFWRYSSGKHSSNSMPLTSSVVCFSLVRSNNIFRASYASGSPTNWTSAFQGPVGMSNLFHLGFFLAGGASNKPITAYLDLVSAHTNSSLPGASNH